LIICLGLGIHTLDLPQGNTQASIKRPNSTHGCRFCTITSDSWLDIKFDTIKNSRYEFTTRALFAELSSKPTESEQQAFARQYGLSSKAPHLFETLVFDRHLQIPVDPAHCICQGLSRVLLETTITIMSGSGRDKFSTLVRQMELPHGWPRFQDPVHHFKSYFFSDLARLVMIGPLVLVQLSEVDFTKSCLQSLKVNLSLNSLSQAYHQVLGCWVKLASASAIVFSSETPSYEDLDKCIIALAKQLATVSLLCFIFYYIDIDLIYDLGFSKPILETKSSRAPPSSFTSSHIWFTPQYISFD
jgi:hypothetical protein